MGAWQRIDLTKTPPVVVNVEEWQSTPALVNGVLYVQQEGAGTGWIWDGAKLHAPKPAPALVPASVTNFQARVIMRQTIMPDGRSLFTTVNEDLAAARAAVADRADSDPEKIEAEVRWQAWEQANDYLRHGPLVLSLADRFGFDAERTDDLFRRAAQVIA